MTSYLFIGFLVGSALSLTGGGGALLAIPLLMGMLSLSLKSATFISLIVVMIASLIGLLISYKDVRFKVSSLLFVGSILGSLAGRYVKELATDQMITTLLYVICIYGLYSVWFTKSKNQHQLDKTVGNDDHVFDESKRSSFIFLSLSSGVILGLLTTLTGLGGGVLLLPLFLKVFSLSQTVAVATSLMTIFLSAGSSLFIQFSGAESIPNLLEIFGLVIGVLVGNLPIRYLVKKLTTEKVILLRKISYGLIVLYTVAALYFKESL